MSRLRVHPAAIVVSSIPFAFAVAIAAAPAEWAIYDARLPLRGERPWPADLVSVRVDEATVTALGGWPLPASSTASLLDALHAAGTKTIVLDVFLGTAGGPEGEAKLAPALAHTVTAVTFDPANGRPPTEDELRAVLVPAYANSLPQVEVRTIAFPPDTIVESVARLGHAGFRAGSGPVRSSPPLVHVSYFDGSLPSQALAALIEHRGIDPAKIAATHGSLTLPGGSPIRLVNGETLLDLGPGGPREIAAADLLAGKIPAGSLAGALAVVHVDSPEDRHASPLAGETPGGLLLATAIRTLDGGRPPYVFPLWASLLICASLVFAPLTFPKRQTKLIACAFVESTWIASVFLLVPVADVFLPLLGPLVIFAGAIAAVALSAPASGNGGPGVPS